MASITQKANGTFLIRISQGIDTFGKQIVRSRIFKPSKLNLSYPKLQKELNAFIQKFEDELANEEETQKKTKSLTFRDFVPEYLAIKKGVLAPETYAFYQRVIETELLPKFGPMKLEEIRTRHIQDFIQYLCEIPRKDGNEGQIQPSTVKRYTTVLRSIMTLAYKLEYTDDDVGQSRRITFPKAKPTEIEVYSLEEIKSILAALDTEPYHIRAIIETALFTGCRRGEIVGLK